MNKIIGIVITIVIVSFYYFPIEFTFLPGINTKMAMAALGLCLFFINSAKSNNAIIDSDFFSLSIFALVVSLVGFVAVTYNDTNDYVYASYIISMWVWLGSAYWVVSLIRWLHGKASILLVANYLIAVCVVQCILALLIDEIPSLGTAVSSVVYGVGFVDINKIEDLGRLYGIGASLDVAGTRFSAALIMIGYIVSNIDKMAPRKYLMWYILSIAVLGIVGNMISRTTTVGLIVCLLYLLYSNRDRFYRFTFHRYLSFLLTCVIIFVGFVFIKYLYNTSPSFHSNLRFAFEGFFSLVEKGEWDVHSNEVLKSMYIFPDNMKTWIIGDGYFDNPIFTDAYYTGHNWIGFYHDTDVGYLRFIYYFGLMGLMAFSLFILKTGYVLICRFTREKMLFYLLITLNFVIWLKVSTDIFLVYALFLMVNKEENEKCID